MTDKPRIIGVAIRLDGVVYSMEAPKRHSDLISQFHYNQVRILDLVHEQGFLTSDNRFVNRHQARGIAWRAHQIKPDRERASSKFMTSEDLW